MKPYVVVATKGRPKETFVLLNYLAQQTTPAEQIIVVGSTNSDVEGLAQHPLTRAGNVNIHLSDIGSCKQRNSGLDYLSAYVDQNDQHNYFVVFFDDDFRPANDWLAQCAKAMHSDASLMGISGRVLADGIHGDGHSELATAQFLNGLASPISNPFSGDQFASLESLYGCNMAFRGTFSNQERFDENLPLYGWQEDADYSNRVLAYGHLQFNPQCIGVHMGISSGRTSGVKFGYSQIANPFYLVNKGTLSYKKAFTLMSKNIISNIVRTITFNTRKDYRGRLCGNLQAIGDLITASCHPTNIINK